MRRIHAMGGSILLAAVGLFSTGCAEDPFDFDAPRSCEVGDQNEWVYDVLQQVYLFEDQLEVVDPRDFQSPAEMVAALRVPPDRWSRVSDKAKSDALFKEGEYVGLGYSPRRNVANELVVSFVVEDSPAGHAGVRRGDIIRAVGGFQIAQIDEAGSLSDLMGENVPGVSVDLTIESDGVERDLTLTKDWIEMQTVPVENIFEIGDRRVGYLMFASFVDPADDALDDTFSAFKSAGITDLVIDMRYNGGGLLSVARHLVSLVLGQQGLRAYRVRYNDNYADSDHDVKTTSHAGSLSEVDRVVVITTGSTLSASELVINSLRPYVDVKIVGDTTGGKPVGSRHISFCDSVMAALTFELVNAAGEGDYFDGFAPDCPAADDFDHPLGDPNEASLASALALLAGDPCPEPPPDPPAPQATADPGPQLATSPTRAAPPLIPGLPEEFRGLQ